jgi:hypothetical protein
MNQQFSTHYMWPEGHGKANTHVLVTFHCKHVRNYRNMIGNILDVTSYTEHNDAMQCLVCCTLITEEGKILIALTVRLKCFVLKNIRVLSRTWGEWAPSCLLSHRCSSSTLVTMYSATQIQSHSRSWKNLQRELSLKHFHTRILATWDSTSNKSRRVSVCMYVPRVGQRLALALQPLMIYCASPFD